jgi:chemotaxis protein histidine kinase CheA
VEEGSDLCATCARREQKYGETGKVGPWAGRITEEPLDETHMLGTAWAEKKKPRFLGAAPAGAGSEAASEEGEGDTASTASTAKPKGKPGRKPMSPEEKAAKAAAKKAEKEAEKAEKASAKKAEKEAEKAEKAAAKKTEKEAEKEAAKAAKKAEKAAAKKAEKAAAAPKPKATKKAEAPAAAAGAGAPAAVEGELRFVCGAPCWLKGTNLYEYDDAAEVIGVYMGQFDGTTVIPDGEEGGAEIVDEAAESDTE